MAASTFSAAARTNALANELRGGAAAGRPCSPSCRKALSSVVVPGRRLGVFSCDRRDVYGSLSTLQRGKKKGTSPLLNAYKAARLLGPPTRFEASKLKVVFMREGIEQQSLCTTPRVYTLTHCDFTANLTLEVSNNISSDALREWQTTLQRDDVVAEWKMLNGEMTLHVHCFVSGANLLQDLAASFRYHIFSKELPLVLKAVLYGDGDFFHKHPELLEAKVLVYFHSKSKKYNCVECWGPLKDAAQRKFDDRIFADREGSIQNSLRDKIGKLSSPKTILHALVSFLL